MRENKGKRKMADEDVEMENFSEERAESASDFTAEDENEKVTWLKTFCLKQCFKQKAVQILIYAVLCLFVG